MIRVSTSGNYRLFFDKLDKIGDKKIPTRVTYNIARKFKYHLTQVIKSMPHHGETGGGHNTPTSLATLSDLRKNTLRKNTNRGYSVRMKDPGRKADAPRPLWVEEGHAIVARSPENGKYYKIGQVKPTFFWERAVKRFNDSGDVQKIILNEFGGLFKVNQKFFGAVSALKPSIIKKRRWTWVTG